MTFPGGDPGANPRDGAGQPPEGGYEAPPIEEMAPGNFDVPPDYTGTPAKTNPLAIGALAASAIGLLCGIGSIAGIALGFVALNQIKRTGQPGHGLAVAGIAVGIVSLVLGTIGAFYLYR